MKADGIGGEVSTGGATIARLPLSDAATFERIWRCEAPRLHRLAMNLLDDPHDAAEVVQEAFTKAWPRWGSISDHRAYLTRAVVNTGIDLQRRRARRRRHDRSHTPAPTESPEPTEPLLMLVDRLAPKDRAIIILRYGADLAVAEIAHVMDLPLGTVKSRLHRALATLAKELEP